MPLDSLFVNKMNRLFAQYERKGVMKRRMAMSSEIHGEERGTMDAQSIHSLQDISQQFFEMVPVRRMKWKDEEAAMLISNPDLQRHLLLATVNHPICVNFPPAVSYMRYFMKLLINKMESEGAEICDEMYEAYTYLLSCHEDEEDTLCYKSYLLPCGERISLQESVNLVSQGTTGLSTWQAAQNLSEWLIENPQIVANRTVVELGSGQGLTGIMTCKQCQPKRFTFSDCHSQVLYLLSRNIERNLISQELNTGLSGSTKRDKQILNKIRRELSQSQDNQDSSLDLFSSDSICTEEEEERREEDEILSDPVELDVTPGLWDVDSSHRFAGLKCDKRVNICHFDWECVKERILEKLRSDIILAADVVYDSSIIPALVFVLKNLLEKGASSKIKPCAYVASTIRNEDTRDTFLIAMGSEGLSYSVVEPPKQKLFHYDRSVPIEILKIVIP